MSIKTRSISETPMLEQITDNANLLIEEDGVTNRFPAKEFVGNADPNRHAEYFDITLDGVVSLKDVYRGAVPASGYDFAKSDMGVGNAGSRNNELPENLIVPDMVEGTSVTGFQVGAFYGNTRIKNLTISQNIVELPDRLCREAVNLKTVNGTEQVIKVGTMPFAYTRIETLSFPNLKEMANTAFGATGYLYSIDIGDHITAIPKQAFQQDTKLSLVRGGSKVTSIGDAAFKLTNNLKNLPLLSHVTSIGSNAFYRSRIQFDWSTLAGECTFGTNATPVMDNTTDYWTGTTYTKCENPLVTIMSQKDARWKDEVFGETGDTYYVGCSVFTALHIHSALSGKVYNHPDEFAEEIRAIDSKYVTSSEASTKYFLNVAPFFIDLGYNVTEYSAVGGDESYQEILNALARGAYVYQIVGIENNVNSGHAVCLYGINENGEVLVLDPDCYYENYRSTGNIDSEQKYRIPFQNITGPEIRSVIVERKS